MRIGGGNVTDWRYDKTSVLKAAKNLHGELLLLHGVIDDNVHLQNTMQLTYAREAHAADDVRLHAGDAACCASGRDHERRRSGAPLRRA